MRVNCVGRPKDGHSVQMILENKNENGQLMPDWSPDEQDDFHRNQVSRAAIGFLRVFFVSSIHGQIYCRSEGKLGKVQSRYMSKACSTVHSVCSVLWGDFPIVGDLFSILQREFLAVASYPPSFPSLRNVVRLLSKCSDGRNPPVASAFHVSSFIFL